MLVKYRVTVCMFLFWEIDKMTLMTRVTFQTTVVSTLITYYLLKLILISKYDAFLYDYLGIYIRSDTMKPK